MPNTMPAPISYARSSFWWLVLVMAALIASGCTTTSSSSAGADDPIARLAQQHDFDGIERLLADLEASRQAADANELVNPASDFVATALSHLGTRYRYGGTSPDTGFDCSGLVWFVAHQTLGLKLPRTAAAQAKHGIQVARSELQEGDLVFFNTRGRRFSHVGIYVGDGRFVHAPRKGAAVRVEQMSARYWTSRYNGARRLAALTHLAANR